MKIKKTEKVKIKINNESAIEHKILKAPDSKKIMRYALSLVAKYSFSEKNLYEKLLQKGYGIQDAKFAIKRLKELNYLDDRKFAATYANFLSKKNKGEIAIKFKLMQKGIKKELIEKAVLEIKNDKEPFQQIMEIVEKKFKTLNWSNRNEIKKTAAFFERKGFSVQDIVKAFRIYNIDIEEI
jgi:regulatory protein